MRFPMDLHISGMTRFRADDGVEYATAFIMGESVVERDKLGVVASEAKSDYRLIDLCKDFTFPAHFKAEVELVTGAKKKTTLFIHSLKPADAPKAASTTTNPNSSK